LSLLARRLARLKKIDNAPNDPEAETLIREGTGDEPHAVYHLVQTVLIQDLSLHVAQRRIAELEKSLLEAKAISFLPPGLLLDESKRIEATRSSCR
jgi:hypothetical protein